MDLRHLTDTFSVAPQIAPEDVPAIAGAGFRAILCNRPDGEDPGQPAYDRIAEAARAEGLEVRWVPVISGQISLDTVDEFRAALAEMPAPLLAYCRSGTRCTMLWAIVRHGTMDDDEIVRRAAAAGYDVAGLIRQISAR